MFGHRDARAAAKWLRFADRAARARLTIVHVVGVYQVAQNGTKAVVTVYGDPQARDAWFWWDRVEIGTTLAVAFSSGYGPHTHRDGVIFVGGQTTGSGVYDHLSSKILDRAQRHQVCFKAKHAQVADERPRAASSRTATA